MSRLLFLFSFFIIAFAANNPVAAQTKPQEQCYVITYSNIEKDFVKPYIPFMEQIYSNIGACAYFIELPYNRLMHMVENNQVDAIIGRSIQAQADHPDLVYVPTPLIKLKGYFIGMPAIADTINNNHSAMKNYNIGALEVSEWSNATLRNMGVNVKTANNTNQLFNMYRKGRIDGFLVTDPYIEGIKQELQKANGKDVTSIVLHDIPVYHVLAPKNDYLVDALDMSVQKLHESLIASPVKSPIKKAKYP